MKISTRGRYALRVMIDLAEHRNGEFIPLKEIAARQDFSQKYLESIMVDLSKGGLIEGQHGKGGGYKLSRETQDYTVGDILRVAEGDLAPVSCLEKGAKPCARASECRTLAMWQKFYDTINTFFDGITLAELVSSGTGGEYVI